MITELDKSQFYLCKPLLRENGHLEVKAVIEGINSGRVFVDYAHQPTTALVWLGNNDGFFFIGDENNCNFNDQIVNFIDTFIKHEAKKVHLNWFEIIGYHSDWNTTIERLFQNYKLESWNQRVYLQHPEDVNLNSINLNHEFELVNIHEILSLYQYKEVSHDLFLNSKLKEFWPSPERFLEYGIGYCIIHHNRVVSVCFSGFVLNNIHCIDIETVEEYRGRKLAQCLALAFVRYCSEKHMIAYWDVMEDNKPSVSIAESTGLKLILTYKGYYFKFN